MTENGNTIKWRVDQLERCQFDLTRDVKSILENHLPHIQTELEAVKARVTILSTINFFAIICAILFAYLMRT